MLLDHNARGSRRREEARGWEGGGFPRRPGGLHCYAFGPLLLLLQRAHQVKLYLSHMPSFFFGVTRFHAVHQGARGPATLLPALQYAHKMKANETPFNHLGEGEDRPRDLKRAGIGLGTVFRPCRSHGILTSRRETEDRHSTHPLETSGTCAGSRMLCAMGEETEQGCLLYGIRGGMVQMEQNS